jgi:phospholipid/cholesterol/gamma-HCH transport system ATP-binding protein
MQQPIVEVRQLQNIIGLNMVHESVNLTVNAGQIFGIIGGSGSGKTTILRNILMLLKPTAGEVKVFGVDVARCNETEAQSIRRRWGVMFQQGALFSGMTVLENIMFPLMEFARLPKALCQEIALLKVHLVGLNAQAANKYPAELSGGMLKRAAAARAIAMDPELLILDEPTAGLDPKSTEEIDELLLQLRASLGLTVIIVSHDVDSMTRLTDQVAFLGDGKVLEVAPIEVLKQSTQPLIYDYFSAYAEGRRKPLHTIPIVVHPLKGVK